MVSLSQLNHQDKCRSMSHQIHRCSKLLYICLGWILYVYLVTKPFFVLCLGFGTNITWLGLERHHGHDHRWIWFHFPLKNSRFWSPRKMLEKSPDVLKSGVTWIAVARFGSLVVGATTFPSTTCWNRWHIMWCTHISLGRYCGLHER